MKKIIKKLIPENILLYYHYYLALKAAIHYKFPSRELVIIGVTGTKGKTSTTNFIWAALTAGGKKTGIISTANIRIGEEEEANKMRMTMPGRSMIQGLLRKMVEEGCTHAVIETSSEGLKQFRHIGINYDYVVFTNLTPEHLPSHGGSFEKYKEQKGVLFKTLSKSKRKEIKGRHIPKVSIINYDSPHRSYFEKFPADEKISYSIDADSDLQASNVKNLEHGMSFTVGKKKYEISLPGKFNIYNSLPALAIAKLEKIPLTRAAEGIRGLDIIPGRMEKIDEGQNFTVFVDYAHEAESMRQALEAARTKAGSADNVIVLLGAEGGGRDKSKRSAMGEVAAELADIVVVSNVDPYDDDPRTIIEDITRRAEELGKVREKNLFAIEDRRLGIRKALSVARPGDVVIITGKGAELSMVIGERKIPWDERAIVREEILNLKK